MNINQKIQLKGLTSNLSLLIQTNYSICELEESVGLLQIQNKKYDVISTNHNLTVHKHVIGDYFTYRVSSFNDFKYRFEKDIYEKEYIRHGSHGVRFVLKIKNYFNE